MKLLLTSAGTMNHSIATALEDLVGQSGDQVSEACTIEPYCNR